MHATDSSGTRLEYFWPVEEQTLFCVLFVCLFVCLFMQIQAAAKIGTCGR